MQAGAGPPAWHHRLSRPVPLNLGAKLKMNIVQALLDATPVMLVSVGVALCWAMVTGSRPALVSVVLSSSAMLFALLYLAWFFRDGLGPDAIASTGAEAAARIAGEVAVPFVIWLVANGLAVARFRSRRARAG